MKKILFILLLLVPLLTIAQQKTYVPDYSFEYQLESLLLGDGIPNNDSVWTSAIDTVTYFSMDDNIVNYKGIEDFIALEELYCIGDNQVGGVKYISKLDLSNNLALTFLYCSDNQIDTLNISNNLALKVLICDYMRTPELDVSYNINLEHLSCKTCFLSNLNLDNNINLKYLNCPNAPLTSLDLSNNPNLEFVKTNYDFSFNALEYINMRNGNNTNIISFSAVNSPNLACINVDDSLYSAASSNWVVDNVSVFAENCTITSIEEENTDKIKGRTLIKIVDILGRETKAIRNTLLFYNYQDGSVEKMMMD